MLQHEYYFSSPSLKHSDTRKDSGISEDWKWMKFEKIRRLLSHTPDANQKRRSLPSFYPRVDLQLSEVNQLTKAENINVNVLY